MNIVISYDGSSDFIEKLKETHPEKFLIIQEVDYSLIELNRFIKFYDVDVFSFDPFKFKLLYKKKFSLKTVQWKI